MNLDTLPQSAKEFSSTNFWHYTSLSTADKILNGKRVYVSNLSIMNDIDELNLHRDQKEYVHCFCLCNSNSEKIPMWYLYAGISGQGAALGFTPPTLLNLLKSIKTVSTIDEKTVLHKEKDFNLDYGWVFYRKQENKSQVCYKRKWYSIMDSIDNFEKDNFFIKSYPWEYEKEFRIIIHNKTSTPYDKLVINLESIYEKIQLKLAPELTEEKLSSLWSGLEGIQKQLRSNIKHSALAINMDLFQRNFDGFVEYIGRSTKEQNVEQRINYNAICDAISVYCKKENE